MTVCLSNIPTFYSPIDNILTMALNASACMLFFTLVVLICAIIDWELSLIRVCGFFPFLPFLYDVMSFKKLKAWSEVLCRNEPDQLWTFSGVINEYGTTYTSLNPIYIECGSQTFNNIDCSRSLSAHAPSYHEIQISQFRSLKTPQPFLWIPSPENARIL